jgi:putative membrane protein
MKFTFASSRERIPLSNNSWVQVLTLVFASIWISTFLGTTDMNNWLLENTLTFLALGFLAFSYKKYQFSDLSYLLVCVYLCLHVYGSKYTYAENPFGYWLQDVFHTDRNHFDRIVHFNFGFLLAYPLRELFLIWLKYPKGASWFLPIGVTMSISGLYEIVEWAVADIFFKAQGPAYLGTQGDVWDAQKDIFLAFSGAVMASSIVSLIIWKLRPCDSDARARKKQESP